jgi:hypothetical protein
MITDDLLVYLLFQLIILTINIIGLKKMPLMLFFGIIGTILLSVPTLIAFGDYYLMAVLFILINITIPIIGLSSTMKGK